MSGYPALPVPDKPLTLDEVAERYPTIRQSTASNFDDCALSAYFDLRFGGPWSTVPQAMGIMFHRFAAECLKTMQRQDSEEIPEGIALATLEETLMQYGVPPDERVRVPMREVPTLRWVCQKFARDNRFTVRNIVDVEHRLSADLRYHDEDGQGRTRTLSGQLDVLIADPERDDGAIVVDWKSGWSLPPEREEDDALSYHGYFQQRWYGWLVMRNHPSINRVTLREFYPRRSKVRKATIHRSSLDRVEDELRALVYEIDRCLAAGKPTLAFPGVEPWNPSPGAHCGNCVGNRWCPIEAKARARTAITSEGEARRAVAELQVAEAVRESLRKALRPFVEERGPQPVKWSKGRRVFGMRTNKSGRPELRFFTPEGSDRAPARAPEDRKLEEALRKAAEGASEQRPEDVTGSNGGPEPGRERSASDEEDRSG